MKLVLDGSQRGRYRGDCECGFTWSGSSQLDYTRMASPALPVAEAVVHHRMCHDDKMIHLAFTWRFETWLKSYWDASTWTESLQKGQMVH